MIPLQIPSPPSGGFFLGPVEIRYYAICVLVGIFVAAWLSRRRFVQCGGDADRFDTIALIMVVVGIIGARLYHVITDYQLYFGPGRNPWQAFNIRSGGLGIWAVLGGLAAWALARRYRFSRALADAIASTAVRPVHRQTGTGSTRNGRLHRCPGRSTWTRSSGRIRNGTPTIPPSSTR